MLLCHDAPDLTYNNVFIERAGAALAAFTQCKAAQKGVASSRSFALRLGSITAREIWADCNARSELRRDLVPRS
jgi:hypothetical protein